MAIMKKQLLIAFSSLGIILCFVISLYPSLCSSCTSVLFSGFSSFLGIPLSLWGVWFYSAVLYLTLRDQKGLVSLFLLPALVVSIVLIIIQVVVLKEFCILCLLSSLLVLSLIFINRDSLKNILDINCPSIQNILMLFFVMLSFTGFFFTAQYAFKVDSDFFNSNIAVVEGITITEADLPFAYRRVLKQHKRLYYSTLNSYFSSLNKKYHLLIGRPTEVLPPVDESSSPSIGSGWLNIVVFIDFACPSCKHTYKSLIALAERRKDVKVVFKFFPTTFISHSYPLARFASAAHAQGKFFEVAEFLFDFTDKNYEVEVNKVARKVGVDITQAQIYMSRNTTKAEEDAVLARELSIMFKPSVFLNGTLVSLKDIFSDKYLEERARVYSFLTNAEANR